MLLADNTMVKLKSNANEYVPLTASKRRKFQVQAQHVGPVTVKRNDLFVASHQWEEIGVEDILTSPTNEQLILRNFTLLEKYITQVMKWRANKTGRIYSETNSEPLHHNRKNRKIEVNSPTITPNLQPPSSHLDEQARYELLNFVRIIASMYNDVHYHKFEHATHVAESTDTIFSLITAAYASSTGSSPAHPTIPHSSAYGVTFDPIVLLAMIFGALVHDVEHQGVSNKQLVHETDPIALKYDNLSVAENNSIAVSFVLLNEDRFRKLRECMFGSSSSSLKSYKYNENHLTFLKVMEADECRFRQVVVNIISATDIASTDQVKAVQSRWESAFGCEPHQHEKCARIIHDECAIHNKISSTSSQIESKATNTYMNSCCIKPQDSSIIRSIDNASVCNGAAFQCNLNKSGLCRACCANLRTASTLELIIQAADVSHTMQIWSIFLKWNKLLLDELRDANKSNRGPDCTGNWFQGQIDFFDGYILPLARRLEQCKIFGVLGSLFYENAMSNRSRWVEEGRTICHSILSR